MVLEYTDRKALVCSVDEEDSGECERGGNDIDDIVRLVLN